MAAIVNFYSDSQCTVPGQVIIPGVAAITGEKANVNNWTHCAWRTGLQSISRGDILVSNARDLASVDGQIVLSGGTAIYDCSVNQTIPYDDLVETDTVTEQSTGLIYNPYFISFDEEDESSFVISISATSSTEQTYNYFKFGLMYYRQTPVDASKRDRETWSYNGDVSNPLAMSDLLYLFKATSQWDANMRQIKMYKAILGDEKVYYLFAFGVTADGKYNDASNPGVLSPGTNFIAVPADYFKDKEPMPWVGPPGEDDSEEGFAPENEIHDEILPRELTTAARDPYGIAIPGSGIKVVFPNVQSVGDVVSRESFLSYFLGLIYRGSSEGMFNEMGQLINEFTGGNTHRPAEEVNAMISAIICCHTVPQITSYIDHTTSIRSLGGYALDLADYGLRYFTINSEAYVQFVTRSQHLASTNYTIFESNFISKDGSGQVMAVTPRLNCFLDYEPYTKITLQLPFFKPISLSPSMVYGHTISANYRIDILTGLLYADVYVGNVLVASLSTNVKTDIPIVGQGANGSSLSKIVTSISSLISSPDAMSAGLNAADSALQIADAVSRAKSGTVVGKEGNPSLVPYLSPRTAYLIITHPRAAIPVSKSGKATFLDEVGMAANLAYKVGECAGGWNKFSSVDLSTVQAPQAVKDDILAQLMQGVYIK